MRRWLLLAPLALLLLAACRGPARVVSTPPATPGAIAATPTSVTVAPPAVTPTLTALSDQEIAQKLRRATVMVMAQFAENAVNAEGLGNGTGVVYNKERGLILTNAHVVEGASAIKIAGANSDRTRPARVLGRSQCDDLAVLKVDDTEGLEEAPFGDSDKLQVGAEVVALGFAETAELGHDLKVTSGSVSKLDIQREKYQDLIQTDAPITFGNSGGPLVNRQGEVIGLNTLGYFTESGERVPDINWAIAMTNARSIVQRLEEGKNRHYVGLNVYPNVFEEFYGTEEGVAVLGVATGSPAAQLGILPADLILKLEGSTVNTEAEFCNILRSHGDGDQIKVQVLRVRTGEYLQGVMTMGVAAPDSEQVAKLSVINTVAVEPTAAISSDTTGGTTPLAAVENVVLSSDFSADTGAWPVGDGGDFSATIADGRYQMQIKAPEQFLTVAPDKSANIADGVISTDISFDGTAPGYAGVIMRYTESGNNRTMYVCAISQDGKYLCSKSINSKWTPLVEATADGVINIEGVNRITMSVVGNQVTLTINDKETASFTDDSISGTGVVGFYIENFDNPLTVFFDNVQIASTRE